MAPSALGYIWLKICKAELTRDVEQLGEQDPFVRVTLGDFKQQTQTCEDAGKYPDWDRVLQQPIPIQQLSDDVLIEVFDEDKNKVTLIGETTVKAGTLSFKDLKKRWLTLYFKGKEAGDLLIESRMMTTQEYWEQQQQKEEQQQQLQNKKSL